MKNLTLTFAVIAVLALSACDKPTVVNVPEERNETVVVPVPVPGPAGEKGEPGEPGKAGDEGVKGEAGESGDTTIIIPPPEAAPATP